jgi:hypothetical protein
MATATAREASPGWAQVARKQKKAAKRAAAAAATTRLGSAQAGDSRPQPWTKQQDGPRDSATTKWACRKCGHTNPMHHRRCNGSGCGTRWNFWDSTDRTPLLRPTTTEKEAAKEPRKRESGNKGTPRVAPPTAAGATGAAGTRTPRADGTLPPSPAATDKALPNEQDLANLEALVAKLRTTNDTASTQMAVHLASQADSLRGALAERTAAQPAEEAPPKTPPPAEILLTRQVRTIAKLQKQAERHRSAVAAAEEGVTAAQNLLAAQQERLAKAEARLQEAEETRQALVAGLQQAAPPQGAMEVDLTPKESEGPLATLGTAVLPHFCTFLGQLLVSGSPEDMAKLAHGLKDHLQQHIPDHQKVAKELLQGMPPRAAPPAAATATAATGSPAAAAAAAATAAGASPLAPTAPATTAASTRPAELPPPAKKQATEEEKAKAAALGGEKASGDQAAVQATTSGDEADEEDESDNDANRQGRSRSPKDRTTKQKQRDPREPRTPTPEREGA